MALGEFTKQLAKEALLDTLKPADTPAAAEKTKTAAPPPAENLSDAIVRQVQAMQSAVKDGEELVVMFHSSVESLRVLEIFVPSPQLLVLTGVDGQKNVTRVVSAAQSLQLTCKVMKIPAGGKATPIRFVAPKPKQA